MKLSKKALEIKPSATLAISGKAKQMRASGINVVNFSAGEPDFDTPERVNNAAIQSINDGKTKYTLVAGIVELREAIAKKMEKDYGFQVSADQVLVSCGAKHSLYLAFATLLDEKDEVIVPAPYWVSYPPQISLVGATPVILETKPEDNFKMTPEGLKSAITDKTRMLVLNSPSNPTGQLYTKEELLALSEVIIENDLTVICDDIYEKLVYGGKTFISMASVSEEMRKRSIVINGVSKCSSMTGWRIGFMVAEEDMIKAATRIQGQMTSNPSSIAQYAALEAIGGKATELESWVQQFEKRRDVMVQSLNAVEGIECATPDGAFYAFADIHGLKGRKVGDKVLNDDMDWAAYLLESAHVATVPGSPFGAPGFLRFSFATSLAIIEEGMEKLKKAVEETR